MNQQSDQSWHWLLELKLRKTSGNAFQTFFSDLMEAKYGEDFVRVKPYGRLGDKGCDGYLQSTGTVYACYGAQNGATGAVASFIKKMNDDFAKARTDLGGIMKSWQMTHNIIEGLPVEAILAKDKLEKDHTSIEFGFVGKPKLLKIMGGLSEDQRVGFLGEYARNQDYYDIQMIEVKELVDSLVGDIESMPLANPTIEPVSPEKLELNKIPAVWAQVLRTGRVNAHHIRNYFDAHAIPTRGESVAQIFREKYLDLRSQSLDANTIMSELYEFVAGPGAVSVAKQVAAHSLLSYLFERCEIFENLQGVDH